MAASGGAQRLRRALEFLTPGVVLLLAFLTQRCGAAEPPAPAPPAQWNTVYEGLQGLNCTTLVSLFDLAGTSTVIKDPTLQIIMLAPTNAGVVNARDFYKFNVSLPVADRLRYLAYHMIPVDRPQAKLELRDGLTVSTRLTPETFNLANMTFRLLPDPNQAYAGGLPPGAIFNPAASYTAGLSRIYLIDNILLPPSTLILPASVLPGLTIAAALTTMVNTPGVFSSVSIFTRMVKADAALWALANEPDSAMTWFIPTDAGMQRLFNRLGVTLQDYQNTEVARALVQAHILPDRPWKLNRFPAGSTSIPSLHQGDYITVTSYQNLAGSGPVVSVSSSGNVVPITIIEPDIYAGKSILHIINDAILTTSLPSVVGGSPAMPAPAPPSPLSAVINEPLPRDVAPITNAPPPAVAPASSPSPGLSGGAIGGIVGGVVGGVLLLALIAGFAVHKHRQEQAAQRRSSRPGSKHRSSGGGGHDGMGRKPSGGVGSGGASGRPSGQMGEVGGSRTSDAKPTVHVQGFIYGDPFVRSTAPQYSWTDVPGDAVLPGVEVGVNDQELDMAASSVGSPVIRLSRADVVKQIRLLRNGLLGRGSSALVFKCQWPSRFGTNALLAIKVLKDPYEADPSVYESFCYEAAVLATVKHQNVVRMFGYCLELPTACIIMELLPSTLKDKMYKRLPEGSLSASATLSGHTGRGPMSTSVASQPPMPVQLSNPSETAIHIKPAADSNAGSQAGNAMIMSTGGSGAPRANSIGRLSASSSQGVPNDASNGVQVHKGDVGVSTVPASPDGTSASLPVPATPQQQRSSSPPDKDGSYQSGSKTRLSFTQLDVEQSKATTASNQREKVVQYNRLSMAEVLRISADIAAGLAYLHKRPAVVSLPPHPTLMLELPQPPPLPVSPPASQQLHTSPSGALVAVPDDEEEDEAKAIARIVHRDLKPSNILISSSGTAKISDFGLARWHNNTTVHTGKLGVGTLRYMAPELLLGHYSGPDAHPMTNRVDIYSLGMLMWEMASAQMPWSDMTDAQIVASVISKQRPNMDGPPSEVSEPSLDLAGSSGLLALMRALHHSTTGAVARSGGLPELPPDLYQFPELQAIITSCWQQKDFKRPTARVVHKALATLLMTYR